jgi:hypothetical protein
MWLAWMIFSHLLEYCRAVPLSLLRRSALEQVTYGLYVRVDIWRKPQCCCGIVPKIVCASVLKSSPPKALANLGKLVMYSCGSGQTQRAVGSAANASVKISKRRDSSDTVAVLIIGAAITSIHHYYWVILLCFVAIA